MRIAMCFPDVDWMDQILGDNPVDAAFIQQKYISTGLAKDHHLSFIAPSGLHQIAYQEGGQPRMQAVQTWSDSLGFRGARKAIWQIQKLAGVPYLNFFSNFSRYDALLGILPGMDLVYERNSLYNASVAMASKKLGLPYIIFFDADQILEQEFLGQSLRGMLLWRAISILRYNLNVARCVICVSEPAKQHLISKWEVDEEKIAVFPNGVDVEFFKPSQEHRSEMRSRLNFDDSNLVFLFVGSFYKWHDIPTLLTAFAQLWRDVSSARLVLVGSGSQWEAMKQLANELDISSAVTFTGMVPHRDIPKLINACDVAVAPVPVMERDLWLSPMKLFEYMAAGAAIIASGVGQIADIIHDHHNGLLVPPGKPGELAKCMRELLENPLLRRQIGFQARKDALEHYSWNRYFHRLNELFKAVVNSKSVHGI
jgi:glycosyltransferase involved in cell wall biosynthesis